MPYETFNQRNASEGAQVLFQYAQSVTHGVFTPMLLFTLFVVFAVASYVLERNAKGEGNFVTSLAIASWLVSGIAIVLTFIPNIIQLEVVVIVITLSGIFTLWLFFQNKE